MIIEGPFIHVASREPLDLNHCIFQTNNLISKQKKKDVSRVSEVTITQKSKEKREQGERCV